MWMRCECVMGGDSKRMVQQQRKNCKKVDDLFLVVALKTQVTLLNELLPPSKNAHITVSRF